MNVGLPVAGAEGAGGLVAGGEVVGGVVSLLAVPAVFVPEELL